MTTSSTKKQPYRMPAELLPDLADVARVFASPEHQAKIAKFQARREARIAAFQRRIERGEERW